MTNAVAPMQDFIERLKTSLRDDVARMIPEEMLAQMIQSVIREEFFTGKSIKDNYGNEKGISAPRFHAMIIEAMTPVLKEKAAEIAMRVAPEIDRRLRETIEAGVTQVIMAQVNAVFSGALGQLGSDWGFQQAVQTALRNQGLLK